MLVAIYCSRSAPFIKALAREGISVTGHVGLVPNLAAWTGFLAVGETFPDEHPSAVQNMFIGREPRRYFGIFVDEAKLKRNAADIFRRMKVDRPRC